MAISEQPGEIFGLAARFAHIRHRAGTGSPLRPVLASRDPPLRCHLCKCETGRTLIGALAANHSDGVMGEFGQQYHRTEAVLHTGNSIGQDGGQSPEAQYFDDHTERVGLHRDMWRDVMFQAVEVDVAPQGKVTIEQYQG